MPDQFPELHRYQTEIEMALAARASGNEGKARVCARRAAGIIVGEYLKRQGVQISDPSAYNRLRTLLALRDLPADIRTVLEHMLIRVTPDQQLPIDADLIAEAQWLKTRLLG